MATGATGSSTALALPGTMVPQVPATATDKLDPRFRSMLVQAKIPEEKIKILADLECDTPALFGGLAGENQEKDFWQFCKEVLLVDPGARPAEIILRTRLTMLWETCKVRSKVEAQAAAERAVARLPPQITALDHELAKEAFEQMIGDEWPTHLTPSQPYFERKVHMVEGRYEAESLMTVTNFDQQDANALPSMGVDWTPASSTGTIKLKVHDFAIPMPQDAEELYNRMKVLATATMFCKRRFPNDPKLATASMEMFQRYVDFLKGPRVWGYVSKDANGTPTPVPRSGTSALSSTPCASRPAS